MYSSQGWVRNTHTLSTHTTHTLHTHYTQITTKSTMTPSRVLRSWSCLRSHLCFLCVNYFSHSSNTVSARVMLVVNFLIIFWVIASRVLLFGHHWRVLALSPSSASSSTSPTSNILPIITFISTTSNVHSPAVEAARQACSANIPLAVLYYKVLE